MDATEPGKDWIAKPPTVATIGELQAAAAGCRACPLWKNASQTVFGEGPSGRRTHSRIRFMAVGESPGDQEDRVGKPFVGPAGILLDKAFQEAGISREDVYITNAVKHFKWEPKGKRRIHQKPSAREIAACRPWLEAELAFVQPDVLICLGATASQAIFGAQFRVTRDRGKPYSTPFSPRTLATVHPSSLLRAPDEESRRRDYSRFVADLKAAKAAATS